MEDSIIEGKPYKLLYVMPSRGNTLYFEESILAGFLREDLNDRKVYFRSASYDAIICSESVGDEVLLYDFSVNIGDSTHQCFNDNASRPDTVIAVSYVNEILDIPVFGLDSVLRIQLGDTSFFDPSQVYNEAVGDVAGIIRRRPHIDGTTFPFTDRSLVKYCRHDSLCGIQIITSPDPYVSNQGTPVFYPSHVRPGQEIRSRRLIRTIGLFDISGKEIPIASVLSDRFVIPASCSPGLYVLKGNDVHGNAFVQKLIVKK